MTSFKHGDQVTWSIGMGRKSYGRVVGTKVLNSKYIVVETTDEDLVSVPAISLKPYDASKLEKTKKAIADKCYKASKLIDEAQTLSRSAELVLKEDIDLSDLIESIKDAGLMDDCDKEDESDKDWNSSSEYC